VEVDEIDKINGNNILLEGLSEDRKLDQIEDGQCSGLSIRLSGWRPGCFNQKD
jgi:hypothetical protein